MSTAEILAELPKLKADERRQVLERLWQLEEADLIRGAGPTPEERRLLDAELAEYEKDRDPGRPWREVLDEIRATKGQ